MRRDVAWWWKWSANGLDGDTELTAVNDDEDDDGETVY